MKSSITIRIYASTLRRIRKNFKAERGETMISYFERLSKYIDNQKSGFEELKWEKKLWVKR